jgi:hypothetical protein
MGRRNVPNQVVVEMEVEVLLVGDMSCSREILMSVHSRAKVAKRGT